MVGTIDNLKGTVKNGAVSLSHKEEQHWTDPSSSPQEDSGKNQFPIWTNHVAWAAPKGCHLEQEFISTMASSQSLSHSGSL